MSALLTFLAVAAASAALLLLPAALLYELFPGLAQAAWRRVRRDGARPWWPVRQREQVLGGLPDDVAARARLQRPPLAGDTCDRCAMSAAASVYLAGGQLVLCGHHGRQYQTVLNQQGAVIVGDLAFRGAQ